MKYDGKKLLNYWDVLLSLCGMIFVSLGALYNAIGGFYGPASKDLGVLRGDYVLSQTLWYAILALAAFYLNKKYTKDNYKKILVVAVVISSITLFAQSKVTALWQVYVLSVIRGITIAPYGLVVVTSSINFWFKKKSAIITSAILAFSGIGGAICSPVFNSIIESKGWRSGYVALAIINVVCLLPALLSKYTYKPEYIGAIAYGSDGTAVVKKTVSNEKINYLSVFFIGCAMIVVYNSPSTFITQQFVGYTSFLAIGSAVGAMMVSVNMVGNISGKFLYGFVAEKLEPVFAILVFVIINMVGTSMLLISRNTTILLVAALLHGAQYAVSASGYVSLVKHIYGVENYPKVYSTTSLISSVSAFFVQTSLGYVYDYTHQYWPLFVISLLANTVIICALFAIRKSLKTKEA